MIRVSQVACLFGLLLSLVGCSGPVHIISPMRDGVLRDSDQYQSVVAFDLRDDSNPSCALLIREATSPNASPLQQTMLLPFPTRGADETRDLFASWSSIDDCCTLVSYIQIPNKSGAYTVSLTPSFAAQPEDVSSLPGQLYLLHLGQERRFIYKYDLPAGTDDLKQLLSLHGLRSPEVVAVARPSEAKGIEVKSGATEIPARKSWNGVASYYAATSAEAGTDHLEIRYELPLSSAQEIAVKFFAELFGVLAPPLATLFFLDLKDPNKRHHKLVALSLLIAVEVGVLSIVGFLAWKQRTTQSTEALLSSVVVLSGLALSVVVAYFKKGTPDAAGTD